MTSHLAIHREEIKARLRIRFKSLARFEQAFDLPRHSVSDVLTGKSRPDAARRIAEALGYQIHELFPGRYTADGSTIIRRKSPTHRQNGGDA
ncbi:MAG: helix-turn-helix domain-containing protein [Pseudomonadota bacterium]